MRSPYTIIGFDRCQNGPQMIVYAIEHGGFNENELKTIRINGERLTFCHKFHEPGLIERLKQELLSPLDESYINDPHPSDYGGMD